jgi:polyhydroxyalkanoate synthase
MTVTENSDTVPEWISILANPASWETWMHYPASSVPTAAASTKSAKSSDSSPSVDALTTMIDPEISARLRNDYLFEFSALVQDLANNKLPRLSDKRFKADTWHSNSLYAFNASAYLLNSRFLNAMAEAVDATPRQKQKIRFAVQQMVDALSPANFLVTNPDAQKTLFDTKGESIRHGIANMLSDVKKGRITQTDESAFEVGKNVATTAGTVIFENDLFQLIQYAPLTTKVAERPLLIVPPCINKFYILDLQPENSLVRYAVEQGNTVLLMSWCNPGPSLQHLSWDDYIGEGVMKAIEVAKALSGQEKINALGFCVGGTLLSTALAVLYGRGENPVSSLTLLTAFLDFSDTGAIEVFIDEEQVASKERSIGAGGLMEGKEFTSAFSSLRPNDLVWNYVGKSYLKGEEPAAFDLLYWNADSTNLPGPMFCWYLRNTYLENNLKHPGRVQMLGTSVDFGLIDAPTFVYASREDHIVPWQSAYGSMSLLNPKKPARNRFVLGASGHIAGVINPPSKNKRSYWTNDLPTVKKNRLDADGWIASTTEHLGSWWPEWTEFLTQHGGKRVNAPRKPGNRMYRPLEEAPGRYVKVKLD